MRASTFKYGAFQFSYDARGNLIQRTGGKVALVVEPDRIVFFECEAGSRLRQERLLENEVNAPLVPGSFRRAAPREDAASSTTTWIG